jgi:fumarylacetoacetate (FAA) hydrolase family protein
MNRIQQLSLIAVIASSTVVLAGEPKNTDVEKNHQVTSSFFESIRPIQEVAKSAHEQSQQANQLRLEATKSYAHALRNIDYLADQTANIEKYVREATVNEQKMELATIKAQAELFKQLLGTEDCLPTATGCPSLQKEILRLNKIAAGIQDRIANQFQ